MLKRLVLASGCFAFLLAAAGVAKGDTIAFTLTVNGQGSCSGSLCSGPFGTITLTDTGTGSVNVSESLNSAYYFVNTGAGDALDFNLTAGKTGSSISNLASPMSVNSGSSFSASTFGSFTNSITCSGCPNGASGVPSPDPQSLSFTVSGVSVSDFIKNTTGYYFASDIADYNSGTGRVIATGNVGANGSNTPVVPEPSSLALFGSGLALLAGGLKMKLFA